MASAPLRCIRCLWSLNKVAKALLTSYVEQKFQKEAIYRQMQEYKREKTTLESQLRDLQRRTLNHDDHLRFVNSWFDQVSRNLTVLLFHRC